jgi:hypothetical protein
MPGLRGADHHSEGAGQTGGRAGGCGQIAASATAVVAHSDPNAIERSEIVFASLVAKTASGAISGARVVAEDLAPIRKAMNRPAPEFDDKFYAAPPPINSLDRILAARPVVRAMPDGKQPFGHRVRS